MAWNSSASSALTEGPCSSGRSLRAIFVLSSRRVPTVYAFRCGVFPIKATLCKRKPPSQCYRKIFGNSFLNDETPIRTEAATASPASAAASGVTPMPAAIGGVTPMMEQFIEIKAANPDSLLFYRMGDFYELFFEDAEHASAALGIVLTKRGKHQGNDIPMCGVPVHAADDYLQKLIGLGFRVAV